MSNHRAGGPVFTTNREKAPLTTGRLAVWLGFWLMMALIFMGLVVTLAGKGSA